MAVVPRTTARPKPASAAGPSWAARLLHRLYQPGILFPTALAMGLIVMWPYLPAWAPDLSHDPTYQVTAERLQLPARHRWVPPRFAADVLTRAGATPDHPLSLLVDGLSERIAKSLAADPWVKSVREVRQQRDGTIAVELEFRRPVLMVSTPRGMYAVDAEGVLLPPEDFRAEDIREFPLARGVRSLPQVGAGQVWTEPGVRGAAQLAAVLAPKLDAADPWRSLSLAAILVPSNGGEARATYELLTSGGSRIVWGHAPGADSLEPPVEQKLARLVYYRQQCGGFETAQGPTRIDIRDIDVIHASALSEQRSQR
jgi:hypothetical protein